MIFVLLLNRISKTILLELPLLFAASSVNDLFPNEGSGAYAVDFKCNNSVGLVFPIPTFPVADTLILSILLVRVTRAKLSVVPIKLVVGLVDAFGQSPLKLLLCPMKQLRRHW